MKALREIGAARAAKFAALSLAMVVYRALLVSPLRVRFLRLLGAQVGRNVVVHDVRFFNYYRRGFRGLIIGNDCFLGDECLIDLAEGVVLEEQVTLAERVLVLTHLNVGYRDHPLQPHFPARAEPVRFERGCFVGAMVTVLCGVTVGARSFVAAHSLVNKDVPSDHLVAGVPARVLRPIEARWVITDV